MEITHILYVYLSSWAQGPRARCSYAVATVDIAPSWVMNSPTDAFSCMFFQLSWVPSHSQAETASGKVIFFFFNLKKLDGTNGQLDES